MRYYEVAPLRIVRQDSGSFTYSSSETYAVGQIVTIPIGKSQGLGVVIAATATKPAFATKPIENALDSTPPIPNQLIRVALWMSEYYSTHLATVLTTLLPRGVDKKRRAKSSVTGVAKRERTNFLLNPSQREAVEHIIASPPGTSIVHGVTGSGKTSVYLELARQNLAAGKSAIILVPEIALTSQLVAEFAGHFPDIILTHSRQTEAERHHSWLNALHSTGPRIAIGPRSALFLPLSNVGLIAIDEAHEPSFKQDQSPRYSALRVASVLGQLHGAHVIQGSATPLASEYYLAEKTDSLIVHLHDRARHDAVAPRTTLIDMTKPNAFTKNRLFSDKLLAALTETLENKHQALIFHNRRGSASTTLCENCGWSAICPRCFTPLTLHADLHTLRCHICGLTDRVPTDCPECHSTDVIHKGIGTKLIESELRKLFPTSAIARFDGDSANGETVENRYQDIYDGTIDIIIGTQVIAKGLDLPHLRMVGVVQADAGLSLPDFSSGERTFQLLAQVVGRVGRSAHETNLFVQTYQPAHPAITYGIAQDFHGFYDLVIAERRRANFPPFCHLLKLVCIYKTEAAAVKNSRAFADTLRGKYPDIEILGPTPAFYERQRDTYRWQITVKSQVRSTLLDVIKNLPKTHWQYDIDPVTLL